MSIKEITTSNRTERKKEETRQKVISVAMQLFKQNGLEATTMEQIAEVADIAKGTLYNYFPAKEAIIHEYIDRVSREKNAARIERLHELPDTRTRMVDSLSELMAAVQAQKEFFEKYLVYQVKNIITLRRDATPPSGFSLLAAEIIRLGQENGEIRRDMPLHILVALVEFVFIEVTQQFYSEPESFNSAEVIEQCVDLFLNGVKPSK